MDTEPRAEERDTGDTSSGGAITPSHGDNPDDAGEGGAPGNIMPHAHTRLQRRLRRAQRLEDIKWRALDPELYVPRALELLRAIALGEDAEGNPVGADKLQLEALKQYLEMTLGDLPSFTEKVLKDDFAASVFEAAANAIRSAFGDVEGFEERMGRCAEVFRQIILASGVLDS